MRYDSAKTAFEMGHRDSRVTYGHYIQAVKRPEAERFWALRPTTADNIVPMAKAS